jgi:hypothetical protein
MKQLLGIDPGESTGWAVVTLAENGVLKVIDFGVSKDLTTYDLTGHIQSCDLMVVENFLIDPAKSKTGAFDHSDMKTIQVIGALQLQARLHDKRVALQSRAVKPVGYGYLRMKYVKGKKGMHSTDAMAHAVFWAVKNAGAKPLGIG